MLFNSLGYILLLLIVVPLHWLLPHKFRLAFLGLIGIIFYSMWRWEFSILILFTVYIDFLAAKKIDEAARPARKKAWLLVVLTINIGLLVVFKYTYFIYDNVKLFAGTIGYSYPALHDVGIRIILPLGISFYTFHAVSYVVDVYRKLIKPTESLTAFFTYVTFWPQLIAGPILRPAEIMPQLQARRRLSSDDLTVGLNRIIEGLFKKVFIADNLAPLVDKIYTMDPSKLSGFDVWVAALLFGLQIYFDFSGYSDIAIGSARLVGIKFPENFNWPYMAKSPRDFWKRWHISLSSWIRDYVYLPLMGQAFQKNSTGGIAVAASNVGSKGTAALFLTWFIMGIWHGAGWNFAIWGLYHASLIYIYRTIRPLQSITDKYPVLSQVAMFMLSMIGWIPFRAQSLQQITDMYTTILNPLKYTISDRVVDGYSYVVAFGLSLSMVFYYLGIRWLRTHQHKQVMVDIYNVSSVSLMTVCIIVYLRPVRQFIYFQF